MITFEELDKLSPIKTSELEQVKYDTLADNYIAELENKIDRALKLTRLSNNYTSAIKILLGKYPKDVVKRVLIKYEEAGYTIKYQTVNEREEITVWLSWDSLVNKKHFDTMNSIDDSLSLDSWWDDFESDSWDRAIYFAEQLLRNPEEATDDLDSSGVVVIGNIIDAFLIKIFGRNYSTNIKMAMSYIDKELYGHSYYSDYIIGLDATKYYTEDKRRIASQLIESLGLPKVDWNRPWTLREILQDYGYTENEIDNALSLPVRTECRKESTLAKDKLSNILIKLGVNKNLIAYIIDAVQNKYDNYDIIIDGYTAMSHKANDIYSWELIDHIKYMNSKFNGLDLDPIRNFTEYDKETLYMEQPKCNNIACNVHNYADLIVDHIVPWEKGGRTNINNAQLCCKKHHWEK